MIFAKCTAPLALAALIAATPCAAAPLADLASLDREVASFVAGENGDPAGASPIDRRLRLAACPRPVALSWYGRVRESVLLQCPAPGGWRLFVPVRQAAANEGPRVARGDLVAITLKGENFRLTDRGTAMGSGAVGEWIEVRPSRKDAKPVQARIVRSGSVEVPLP